jgi:hypothetical protein
MLLIRHISELRSKVQWLRSRIVIYVEHNLGFESEHHARALQNMPNVAFYRDEKRGRVGMLTTLPIKHAMCTLVNAMFREDRICASSGDGFVITCGRREDDMKRLLRDQLEIYSYQFKQAATVFNKGQVALSGKVGGMRDDLAVLLQLAAYWTSQLFSASVE